MAERLSVDTTFLIDLERELQRADADGPAHRFLRDRPGVGLCLSVVALAEFAAGFEDVEHPVVHVVRTHYQLLPVDAATALDYARLSRDLRASGRPIGSNDLWIAACARRNDLPLLTADTSSFGRVDGLEIVGYR